MPPPDYTLAGGPFAPYAAGDTVRVRAAGDVVPGFVLTTKALLEDQPDPSREDAKHYLAGNLCRCGSYVKILDAVMDAKERVRGS